MTTSDFCVVMLGVVGAIGWLAYYFEARLFNKLLEQHRSACKTYQEMLLERQAYSLRLLKALDPEEHRIACEGLAKLYADELLERCTNVGRRAA